MCNVAIITLQKIKLPYWKSGTEKKSLDSMTAFFNENPLLSEFSALLTSAKLTIIWGDICYCNVQRHTEMSTYF